MLWTLLLMPLLGTLAHGSLAHSALQLQTVQQGVGEHTHGHGMDHHHDESDASDAKRFHSHGADHTHDPGKILPTSVMPGLRFVAHWQAHYHFSLIPEPVSRLERPPKSALA